MSKSKAMNEDDRKFVIKIAKGLEGIEKRLGKMEEAQKKSVNSPVTLKDQPAIPAVVGQEIRPRTEPVCVISSTFALGSVEAVMQGQKNQDELRKIVIDFCKKAGFQKLTVNFEE